MNSWQKIPSTILEMDTQPIEYLSLESDDWYVNIRLHADYHSIGRPQLQFLVERQKKRIGGHFWRQLYWMVSNFHCPQNNLMSNSAIIKIPLEI